jgi:hypothetical protein
MILTVAQAINNFPLLRKTSKEAEEERDLLPWLLLFGEIGCVV